MARIYLGSRECMYANSCYFFPLFTHKLLILSISLFISSTNKYLSLRFFFLSIISYIKKAILEQEFLFLGSKSVIVFDGQNFEDSLINFLKKNLATGHS